MSEDQRIAEALKNLAARKATMAEVLEEGKPGQRMTTRERIAKMKKAAEEMLGTNEVTPKEPRDEEKDAEEQQAAFDILGQYFNTRDQKHLKILIKERFRDGHFHTTAGTPKSLEECIQFLAGSRGNKGIGKIFSDTKISFDAFKKFL